MQERSPPSWPTGNHSLGNTSRLRAIFALIGSALSGTGGMDRGAAGRTGTRMRGRSSPNTIVGASWRICMLRMVAICAVAFAWYIRPKDWQGMPKAPANFLMARPWTRLWEGPRSSRTSLCLYGIRNTILSVSVRDGPVILSMTLSTVGSSARPPPLAVPPPGRRRAPSSIARNLLATPHYDRHAACVALSRHRESATVIYAAQDFGMVAETSAQRADFGEGPAQAIVENSSRTVVMRCSASERGGTSFASQLIGDRQVVRTTESRNRSFPSIFRSGRGHNSCGESQHNATESA